MLDDRYIYTNVTLSKLAEEQIKTANIGAMTQLVRTWKEAGKMVMKWIAHSNKTELCKVKRYFWRREFQRDEGNLAHMHRLITSNRKKKDEEEMKKIREKVSCNSRDFLNEEDI